MSPTSCWRRDKAVYADAAEAGVGLVVCRTAGVEPRALQLAGAFHLSRTAALGEASRQRASTLPHASPSAQTSELGCGCHDFLAQPCRETRLHHSQPRAPSRSLEHAELPRAVTLDAPPPGHPRAKTTLASNTTRADSLCLDTTRASGTTGAISTSDARPASTQLQRQDLFSSTGTTSSSTKTTDARPLGLMPGGSPPPLRSVTRPARSHLLGSLSRNHFGRRDTIVFSRGGLPRNHLRSVTAWPAASRRGIDARPRTWPEV